MQFQQAGPALLTSAPAASPGLPAASTPGQAFTLQASPASSQPQVTLPPAGRTSPPPQVIWSSGSVTRPMAAPLLSTSTTTTSVGTPVIQHHQPLEPLSTNGLNPPVSPKKKKSKKKKRDDESPTKSQGTVDLGALLKDSGIDFDDFGFGGLAGSSSAVAVAPAPPAVSSAAEPPPVIELNDSTNTLNQSLNSSIGSTSSSEPEVLPALPQLSFNPPPAAAPLTMHLVQGPDGINFRLETNPGDAPTSSSSSPAPPVPMATPSNSSLDQKKFPSRVPPRSRPVVDPNRTPLFEDDTLPPGWHRKVSQRKSGASAGRYEVFIIGPSHKRFRSRNELKSFFEKTGETSLNPDDFDFSTFGRNSTVGATKVRGSALIHSLLVTVAFMFLCPYLGQLEPILWALEVL